MGLRRASVVVLALAAIPAGAEAQLLDDSGPRSPALAFSLSVTATLVPAGVGAVLVMTAANHGGTLGHALGGITMLAVGTCLGPGVGHLYTGEAGTALKHALGRSVLFGVSTLGFSIAALEEAGSHRGRPLDRTKYNSWLAIGGVFAAATLGLGVYDWVDALASAKRVNKARRAVVVPTVVRAGSATQVGLALAGAF